MQAPPGGNLVLGFKEPLDPPAGDAIELSFDSAASPPVGVGAISSQAFGSVSISKQTIISPAGWLDEAFPTWPFKTPVVERAALRIFPQGWQGDTVSSPTYVSWRRYLSPSPIIPSQNIPTPQRVRLAGGYQPAPGSNIILNFAEPLNPPPGGSMVLEFGASGFSRVLGATVGASTSFGAATFTRPDQIRPASIGVLSVVGIPAVQGSVRTVSLSLGIAPPSPQFGVTVLTKRAVALLPTGLAASAFGTALIFNRLQFVRSGAWNSQLFGTAYVIGGVKTVTVSGVVATTFGATVVINTTANQTAIPVGIPTPGIGTLSVSPRIVYPAGMFGVVGVPSVHRNPAPAGFDALRVGLAVVEYKTKQVMPAGFALIEPLGYPRVFDPDQTLMPASFIQSAVFGDTRIYNLNLKINVSGFDSMESAPWTEVVSNRRIITINGLSATAFGLSVLQNKTPSIGPAGFDSLRMGLSGETGIGYRIRHLGPSGIYRTVIGTPTVKKTPQLEPLGFTGAMGAANVWHKVRTTYALGSNSAIFGQITVWYSYRKIAAEGFDALEHGELARVEDSRRLVLGHGSSASSYGVPWVTNANRFISPQSIFENFPQSHAVGGLRFLRPVGFDAARFGSRIIPEIQPAYPLGFVGVCGIPHVESRRKIILPLGITTTVQPADRWGTARAWNRRQYVSMHFDPDSFLNPPPWPQWTLIANRTRVVGAVGLQAAHVSEPVIANNARPLYPAGIAAPAAAIGYKAGQVAYRIRFFHLGGIEAPYMSSWARVYNDADVITGSGFSASLFGVASLVNTRRYYSNVGRFDASVLGYPMVADRIRTLSFEGRYTIGSPPITPPTVKLYTRYIDGIGFDSFGVGAASLTIHFTLITPRWTLQNLYGSPTVRNKTPQLYTSGRAADEFGDANVRLQWRPVNPTSDATMQVFGRTDIAFRDRTLFMSGFRSWAVGDKTRVIKSGSPPYSTQFIYLDGEIVNNEQKDGFGIGIPEHQVSKPIINQQVIYVEQENVSTRFGFATVAANSIRVEPGYWELLIGEPMVSLKIRTVAVAAWPDSMVSQPSPAHVSPQTIWAVMEAPDQARRNHAPMDLHYVRSQAVFGLPTVSLFHRRITTSGRNTDAHGIPSVFNRRSYVVPIGIRSLRFGWHLIPGDQTAEQFGSPDTSLFGVHRVGRPPYFGPQAVSLTGLASLSIPPPRIELFNREVRPSGFDSMRLGTRFVGDDPYMWKGLRVGPLVPVMPSSEDMALLGVPWVSFRVRELLVNGFDSFLCEYALEAFDKRMRVSRRQASIPARSITPIGISGFGDSVPNVRPAAHFIRPDGNSDQFRKGAF